MAPYNTLSGITRGSIVETILKNSGKKGISLDNLWNAFCQNQDIDYDYQKCDKLNKLRRSVLHKWKRSGLFAVFGRSWSLDAGGVSFN